MGAQSQSVSLWPPSLSALGRGWGDGDEGSGGRGAAEGVFGGRCRARFAAGLPCAAGALDSRLARRRSREAAFLRADAAALPGMALWTRRTLSGVGQGNRGVRVWKQGDEEKGRTTRRMGWKMEVGKEERRTAKGMAASRS